MNWNNIISFVVGGLIAIIPVIISNKYQAKEKDKDREERRKEAKILLSMDIKQKEINAIEDSMDDALKALNIISNIRLRKHTGFIAAEEMKKEINSLFNPDSQFEQLIGRMIIARKYASALGEGFYSEFLMFENKFSDASKLLLFSDDSRSDTETEYAVLYNKVVATAGKLHKMLAEKLVSFRE